MRVNVWQIPLGFEPLKTKLSFKEAGYLEVDDFDKNELWDLSNWASRREERPPYLKTTYEGSGTIFENPNDGSISMITVIGWHWFRGWSEMVNFLLQCEPDEYFYGK